MKNRYHRWYILSAMILVFLIAACAGSIATPGPSPEATQAPAAEEITPSAPLAAPTVASTEGLGPAETVTAFYAWYIKYITSGADGPRNPLTDEAYLDTGYVSGELAERARAATGDKGGYDPFLCAQDIPSEALTIAVRESGDEGAAVDVRTSFEGHRFTVALRRNGSAWQIINVICSPEQAGAVSTPANVKVTVQVPGAAPAAQKLVLPEGWQAYRNETYRFQLGYPEGWVAREIAAAEGQPPIGPENTKLIVMLLPEAWAEQLDEGGVPDANAPVLAPFALEVTVGSEEAFWGNYPESMGKEEVKLRGASAVRAIELITQEISIPHLVYQHPVAKELRVVLTDPINGFADRKVAHAEVAAAFEEVANSFAWLD